MLDILKPQKTDLDELSRIQKEVSQKVIKEDRTGEPELIAGCDISFSEGETAFASCVLLDYPQMEKIESNTVEVEVDFPYIPTFLAFRELKPMLNATKDIEADVYMIDSQGLAHPRRAGLASHLGVIIDRPTLGVAKNRLCGEAEEPGHWGILRLFTNTCRGNGWRPCSNHVNVKQGRKLITSFNPALR